MTMRLTRRRLLTIGFDPDMIWAAKPTGKHEAQPVCPKFDTSVDDFELSNVFG